MVHRRPALPRRLLAVVLATALAVLSLAFSAGPAPAAGRSDFVQRDGTRLTLQGKPFRFAGPNAYWLGLDENVGGIDPSDPATVDYPTSFRIRDGLTTAKAMGATAVRAHTLGVSTGTAKALEPELGRYNAAAFAPIDYAVAEAGRLGLKLIIPLTDNWRYYHGSRFDYLQWLGLSTADDGAAFYTDPDARAAYQRYVKQLLQHRNPYTGLRYVDDPTIMAWELGNELNGMTADWVQTNAAYVKKLAPRQLVAAGKQFGVDPAVLAARDVDISDSHYYPPTAAGISADAKTVTDAGKVYLAGEFGSGSATDELLTAVAADPNVTGATFWSLFPHADHYGYVQHDDGFTLHHPGDTPEMRQRVTALTRFASAMSGRAVGRVVGDRPLVTAVSKNAGLNAVAWRGTAGADGYRIQRSVLGGGWKTVSGADPVSANDAPWLDRATVPTSSRYRVQAVDASGRVVATSAPAGVAWNTAVRVDPLEDWFVTAGHSASLRRTPTRTGVEVAPAAGRTGWVSYAADGLVRAELTLTGDRRPRPSVQVTTGGDRWKAVVPAVSRAGDGTWSVRVDGLAGVTGLRLRWAATDRFALSRVSLTDRAAIPTAAPGSFTLTSPAPGAEGVSTQTTISWTPAPDTAYYELVVSEHADLSDPVVSVTGLAGTSYAPAAAWPGGTTLYVRVRAVNGVGATAVSGTPVTFTTRPATSGVLVDDFDTYADDEALQAAWTANSGGDPITPTLGDPGEGAGHSMVLTFGTGANGYAGVIRALPGQDWRGTGGLRLWVQPGRADQEVGLQFTANGSFWEHKLQLPGAGPRVVVVPWTDFAPPPWAPQDAKLDLSSVTALALYPTATSTQDALTVDSISATP
jgi:hypothetical protein